VKQRHVPAKPVSVARQGKQRRVVQEPVSVVRQGKHQSVRLVVQEKMPVFVCLKVRSGTVVKTNVSVVQMVNALLVLTMVLVAVFLPMQKCPVVILPVSVVRRKQHGCIVHPMVKEKMLVLARRKVKRGRVIEQRVFLVQPVKSENV
jgi:hypothetical protein